MAMNPQVKLDVAPLEVPDNVFVGKGGHLHEVPLSFIEADDLDLLCLRFRQAVFKKAGKREPPMSA
jgi:hypothetical protein